MEADSVIDQSAMPPSEECQRQVRRILRSVAFRNAATLQQLLQFLTARALEGGSTDSLKEYIIGVEAFGRPQDFDPKTDTIVRVQIHRLRQKLREYYDSDGKRDPIVVGIPKGHYLPSFEIRIGVIDDDGGGVPENGLDDETVPAASPHLESAGRDAGLGRTDRRELSWSRVLLGAILMIAIFLLGLWIGARKGKTGPETRGAASHEASDGVDPAVRAFWANFVGDDPTPVIAFPDAIFLLDNSNDLFRFRQGASDDRGALVDSHLARQFASNPSLVAQAGALYYENGYTGAGELQGIAMLSSLFGQMGIRPVIKPSRDITPVDLRQHSVILFGSSFQNVAVAQLMTQGDFSFRNPDSHLEQWRAEIVNARPEGQEDTTYHTERDPATRALKADYGIVSIQSGVVPGRHIAMLGGLDTTGTEGAARFATSKSGVEEMEKALGSTLDAGTPEEMPQFQALVRVRLEKGYEVLGSSLVSVHRIGQTGGGNSESKPMVATPAKKK
jgi:hypothetical protein